MPNRLPDLHPCLDIFLSAAMSSRKSKDLGDDGNINAVFLRYLIVFFSAVINSLKFSIQYEDII